MSRIKLDLSAFKHVKSDDKSTTLAHKKDGHTLTLVHKALSPEGKAQLDALSKMKDEHQTKTQDREEAQKLAEGGKVKKESPNTIIATKAVDAVRTANEVRKEKKPEHGQTLVIDPPRKPKFCAYCGGLAHGGECKEPEKMAEGGVPGYLQGPEAADIQEATDPTQIQTYTPEQIAAEKEARLQKNIDMIKGHGTYGQDPNVLENQALNRMAWEEDMKREDERAANQMTAAKDRQLAEINIKRASLGMNPIAINPEQQPASPGVPQQQAQQPAPSIADQVNQQAPMAGQQAAVPTDPESMIQAGYGSKLAGIYDEAKAVGKLGEEQAKAIDKTVTAQETAKQAFLDQYNALNQERQNIIQDIKDGHIDPERYWTGDPKTGEGSHSKIAAGIGMILAGFNPSTSPNAAISFLKDQMDKNLQAQVKNLDSKQSLLSHNLQQYKNLRDAVDMTRIMQNDMLAHQLDSAAANAKTPLAQAAAKQAAGQLMMDSSNTFLQFSMRRAMMNLANGGPENEQARDQMVSYMQAVNPEAAKEMRTRIVPGIPGFAKIPVPDSVRKELVAGKDLDIATKDLLQFTKKHTTLNPLSPEYQAGQQKALQLQSLVREGLLGTVYREGEQPLLDKFVSTNPAGALKMLNNAKLVELLQSNERRMNNLKSQYGLQIQQTSAPQQQQQNPQAALEWAKKNPKDPRAAKILQLVGK